MSADRRNNMVVKRKERRVTAQSAPLANASPATPGAYVQHRRLALSLPSSPPSNRKKIPFLFYHPLLTSISFCAPFSHFTDLCFLTKSRLAAGSSPASADAMQASLLLSEARIGGTWGWMEGKVSVSEARRTTHRKLEFQARILTCF